MGSPERVYGRWEHYPVTGDDIRSSAENVHGRARAVHALAGEVDKEHRSAVAAVEGDLHGPVAAAPEDATSTASKLGRETMYAAATLRLFAHGVDVFDGEVNQVNSMMFVLHHQPEYRRGGETAEEMRQGAISSGNRQYRTAESNLDDVAEQVVSMLNNSSKANIRKLFYLGYMPLDAPEYFPNVHFTAQDYAKAVQAKIEAGELPDFSSMSDKEVETYLKNHPELAQVMPHLLGVRNPSADVTAMVSGQARVDAKLLKGAVDGKVDDAGVLAQIGQAERFIKIINDRLANGGKMTAAEHSYLFTWFNTVGADDLAGLSKTVSSHLPPVPGYAQQGMMTSYVGVVSNAILNLSRPSLQRVTQYDNTVRIGRGAFSPTLREFDLNKDGVLDVHDMPQAIQDLMSMRIGESAHGYRWGDVDEHGNPESDSLSHVQNLEKFRGFASLMAASTVTGGSEFSQDLGEYAIQAKQDLNALQANARRLTGWGGVNEEEWQGLQTTLSDYPVSTLLGVTARNEDASANMLLDGDDRNALLGMNWDAGSGAADVIRAGTDRDPDGGGGSYTQAEAAKALFTEIASDHFQYGARMNEQVSDAVIDSGITWMDTFGANGTGDGIDDDGHYDPDVDVIVGGEDALGREIPFTLDMDDATRANFLQFVSGAGDSDAVRFHAAATVYSQGLISHALDHGTPTQVHEAMAYAGRLDGNITASDYESAIDHQEDKDDQAQAAHDAAVRRHAALKSALNFTIGTAATIGGAVQPELAPFLAVGAGAGTGIVDQVIDDGPDPVPYAPQVREGLFDADQKGSSHTRDYLLFGAMLQTQNQGSEAINSGHYDIDGIVTQNADGSYSAKSLADIESREDPQTSLSAVVSDYYNDVWPSHHHGTNQTDPAVFDTARDDVANGSHYDNDINDPDGWSNDRSAERWLYGDNVPEGYGDDPWEDGPREMYPDLNGPDGPAPEQLDTSAYEQ